MWENSIRCLSFLASHEAAFKVLAVAEFCILGVHLEEDLLLRSYHMWLSEVVGFACLLPRVLCPQPCDTLEDYMQLKWVLLPSFTLLIYYGCANLSLLLCAVPATHQGPLDKVWNKSIPNALSTMNLLFCLPLAGPYLWSFHPTSASTHLQEQGQIHISEGACLIKWGKQR